MNFTLCKNRCDYTKRNKQSRNPPSLRPTLPKPHYPSPRTTTLASLVKGEVLSPERIRATTGGIAFLPHPFRFLDTSVNNPSIVGSASHCNRSSPLHKGAKGDSALPTIPKPHYLSLRTTTLGSLAKGSWIATRLLLTVNCLALRFKHL